jgi:hypothetical protein
VIFFCGLCRPAYPPFVQYPVTIEVSDEAGGAEVQAAADQLAINGVKTIFLAPGVNVEAVGSVLSSAGVRLIGVDSPSDDLKPAWVATIKFDPAEIIRQIWPDLISGQGNMDESASLSIVDVNRDLLSQGRQQWVEKLLSELAGGYIDTGVDPQTGDFR